MGRLSSYCIIGISHSKPTSTQAMPFFLVYRAEAMVPIEVIVPSTRFSLARKVYDLNDHIYHVEALEEKRQNVEEKWVILAERD